MTDPTDTPTPALSPERLAEIRDTDPGEWYRAPWATDYVDSDVDSDEPAYWRVISEGATIATLPDWAGGLALFIAAAREDVPALLAELDRTRTELAKYVGHEPTSANFFQSGHTYTDSEFPQHGWKFRVDTITTNPEDGERIALGWRFFNGEWEPYAYAEDDWDAHQVVGITDTTTGGTR